MLLLNAFLPIWFYYHHHHSKMMRSAAIFDMMEPYQQRLTPIVANSKSWFPNADGT